MSSLLISLPILRNSSNLDSDSSAINNIHVLPEVSITLLIWRKYKECNFLSHICFREVRIFPNHLPLCCSNIFQRWDNLESLKGNSKLDVRALWPFMDAPGPDCPQPSWRSRGISHSVASHNCDVQNSQPPRGQSLCRIHLCGFITHIMPCTKQVIDDP